MILSKTIGAVAVIATALFSSLPRTQHIDSNLVDKALVKYNLNKALTNSKYMVVVDFKQPSTAKRLCVIDTTNRKEVYCTETAHGKNSGGLYAKSFSNVPESNQSSLGLYLVGEPYYGKHGLSIKLDGLERTNSNVRRRAIVIHDAGYIGKGKQGRSLGCFALPLGGVKQLQKYVSKGTLLFAGT